MSGEAPGAGWGHGGFAMLTGSLILIPLCVGLAPVPPVPKVAAGLLLLGLWCWAATGGRARDPLSPVRLLPAQALLFLGLGIVGAQAALWAWYALAPCTVGLDLALGARRRSLARVLYAILWLDLYALLHQLVALGRDLSGVALILWTVGVGSAALIFVGLGLVRLGSRTLER